MNILKGIDVNVHIKSCSGGEAVVDTVTKGVFSRRGGLVRIEYLPVEDMPKGNTVVIVNTECNDKLRITRDGESSLDICAEDGLGSIEVGYSGCYSIKGRVENVRSCVNLNAPVGSGDIFDLEISYIMKAGGMENKVELRIKVLESEER